MIKPNIVLFLALFSTFATVKANPSANSIQNSTYPSFEFPPSGYICTEEIGREFLKWVEYTYSKQISLQTNALWNYETNITRETEAASRKATIEFYKFQAKIQQEILEKCPNWPSFYDPEIRKQFRYMSISGPAKMCYNDVVDMQNIISEMEFSYLTANVCDKTNTTRCDLKLSDARSGVANINDPDTSAYFWTAWHDKMSEKIPPLLFAEYANYQNELARANGFDDMADMWISAYEDGKSCWNKEKFKILTSQIWEEIKPTYEILHSYARMKLRKIPKYANLIDKCGYIPIYLTGNMWGQTWGALYDLTKPYLNASSFDASPGMMNQGYTTTKLVKTSEAFFTSCGLPPMTDKFFEKSVIVTPTDRSVNCQLNCWDFGLGEYDGDYRLLACNSPQNNADDLTNVIYNMGYIVYFMEYMNKSAMFRNGANPGFIDAFGQCASMSASTRQYFQCVLGIPMGLIQSDCDPGNNGNNGAGAEAITDTDFNNLYSAALKSVAFPPFALTMDRWRWAVFEEKVEPDEYNTLWWKMVMENQGLKPPSDRNKQNLLDPVAKYHVAGNQEYMRYFVSFILKFQLYEAACIAANQYDPTHPNTRPLFRCDFFGSKEAGKKLGDMMKLGYSKSWPDALEAITGNRTISAGSYLKYFEPLMKILKAELVANGETPGFGDNCDDVEKKYYHKP